MDQVTPEKLKKYFSITKEALDMAKTAFNENEQEKAAEIFDMAERYFNDAKFFEEKGDLVTAFGALNYSHGWLDCGARLGFFTVKDSRVFTVDDA